MTYSDEYLRQMRATAQKATGGRWGAHGMMLLAGEPGMNVETCQHVADFFTKNDRGQYRTYDLDHMVNMQPRNAIALIDEVLALRKARTDLATALRLTREYVQPTVALPPYEGWSWYDALREHAPEMLTAMEALHVPDHDEYAGALCADGNVRPRRVYSEHVHDASCSFGNPQCPAYGDAEPLPMQGWKARTEERFREYGWTRLANLMARWDERGLGK